MLGISYGELFLLLGATAALIGPKDLPVIARTAGRFAGRAIAYVQLARGQFDSVMQQSQARQVHKELQDAVAQLEAIRHEIRSVSFMNPGPMTRRLVDNIDNTITTGNKSTEVPLHENKEASNFAKPQERTKLPSELSNLHSQATTFARLAESTTLKSAESNIKEDIKLDEDDGFPTVLPVSAETAGLLPNRKGDVQGSDILLEAVVESEVAHNAKDFFSQPENQIKQE